MVLTKIKDGVIIIRNKPELSEYNTYFSRYVDLVPEGDLIAILLDQNRETNNMFKNIIDIQGLFKYAPEKWSIKEVIGHLTDTERILGYSLLCIARGEAASLPSYDKNAYVKQAKFEKQSIEELLLNLTSVRNATINLLKSLQTEDWLRQGIANGSEITVRALATILAGHELHHCKLVKESYFGSDDFPLR